ncbi:MAG: peptidylprolyl isomerase [Ruminococcaceae bacterium]|jgi:peptidyl-prolyl cis-trans isomerase B (cyclophilin B)|nr:peptidylprolyl isomerase [Oscillospiraceae bacterium]
MKSCVSLLLTLLLVSSLLFGAVSCGSGSSGSEAGSGGAETSEPGSTGGEDGTVMIEIEMESGGIIKLELYPDVAPITVENFVGLVKDGFYDGLIFHRVIKGFMIQGGDPQGTGFGGSGKTIKGEFKKNGVENDISHVRGVISMARSQKMDSASSQFFIVQEDSTYLDGAYAAFGRVTEGMDVVDEIASVQTDQNDRPYEDVVIKSIRVIENEG